MCFFFFFFMVPSLLPNMVMGLCHGIVKKGTNTLNSFDVAKTTHPVTQSTFVNLLDNIMTS